MEILRDLYLFGRREGYICCRTTGASRPERAVSTESENENERAGESETDNAHPLETVRIPVDWS